MAGGDLAVDAVLVVCTIAGTLLHGSAGLSVLGWVA
jgi:hypothetical protein